MVDWNPWWGSASQDITDMAIMAPETMASRKGIRNLSSINFQGRTVSFSFKDGILFFIMPPVDQAKMGVLF